MDPAFFIVCDYKPQNLLIFMRIAIFVPKGPKATGAHYRCAFGRKSFVRGLAPPSVRTANPTHTLRVFGHGSPFCRYARPLTDFQTNAYSVMRAGGFLRYHLFTN